MKSERVGIAMTGYESKSATDNSVENVLDSLTPRERQVLGLMTQGFSNRTIAEKLVVNQNSVQNYIHSIFSKMRISRENPEVDMRVAAVLLYQRNTPDFNNPVHSYFEHWEITPLTPRQKEVVRLIGEGYSNVAIADKLRLSNKIVAKRYIDKILEEKIPVDEKIYDPRVVLALISKTEYVGQRH